MWKGYGGCEGCELFLDKSFLFQHYECWTCEGQIEEYKLSRPPLKPEDYEHYRQGLREIPSNPGIIAVINHLPDKEIETIYWDMKNRKYTKEGICVLLLKRAAEQGILNVYNKAFLKLKN